LQYPSDCTNRQIEISSLSILEESIFVDSKNTLPSLNNSSNSNSSNFHLKKRLYCNHDEALTWTPHDDAKHPLGSFECESKSKRRTAFYIGNENQ
jgi:hypothetical protein